MTELTSFLICPGNCYPFFLSTQKDFFFNPDIVQILVARQRKDRSDNSTCSQIGRRFRTGCLELDVVERAAESKAKFESLLTAGIFVSLSRIKTVKMSLAARTLRAAVGATRVSSGLAQVLVGMFRPIKVHTHRLSVLHAFHMNRPLPQPPQVHQGLSGKIRFQVASLVFMLE